MKLDSLLVQPDPAPRKGRPRSARPPASRARSVYLGTTGLALAELKPANFSDRLERLLERADLLVRRLVPAWPPEAWASLVEGLRGARAHIGVADDMAWEVLLEWAHFHGPFAVRAWGKEADPHTLAMVLRDETPEVSMSVMEFLDRYRELARHAVGGAGTAGHAERLRRLGLAGAADVERWAAAELKRAEAYRVWREAIRAGARPAG